MSGPSVAPSPRAELASRVAELNDLVLFGEFSDDELTSMGAVVDGLLAPATAGRAPWWESSDADRAYRARSPFAGVENPRAPALRFDTVDGDSSVVVAEVTLDKAFAGPPGAVHGGVLAGLFDEVIGAAAADVEPSRVVVTAKLAVRYRAATPLRTPLRLEAIVTRRTSRRIIVEAVCRAGDDVTATAEALMVLR